MENIETKQKTKIIIPRIPEELIYETMDGKPIYYKGYKEVIKQQKQIEEIMGSSDIQIMILSSILNFLYRKISSGKYLIGTNEVGLHLKKKTNLAADIAIFEKEKLLIKKIQGKYIDIPPKIIIEIDTKADLNDFDNVMDYYQAKTQKLFNFGVEKVFWILTKNKQIIETIPNKPQIVKSWDKEIHLFDNLKFTLNQLLKEDGIYNFIYE